MAQIHDDLFRALANAERRQILFDLAARSGSVNIDSPPDVLADGGTVAVERRHIHLPMLEAYEFIDWYPSTSAIEAGPRFEAIRPVLDVMDDHRETFPVTSL